MASEFCEEKQDENFMQSITRKHVHVHQSGAGNDERRREKLDISSLLSGRSK